MLVGLGVRTSKERTLVLTKEQTLGVGVNRSELQSNSKYVVSKTGLHISSSPSKGSRRQKEAKER